MPDELSPLIQGMAMIGAVSWPGLEDEVRLPRSFAPEEIKREP